MAFHMLSYKSSAGGPQPKDDGGVSRTPPPPKQPKDDGGLRGTWKRAPPARPQPGDNGGDKH